MARILGTVTIGQSPRVDLIPEIRKILGEDVTIVEAGALDGMTLDEVRQIFPGPGDQVLVTRMADGTAVKIAEKHILERMQAQIDRLVEQGAEVVALVCTGKFPEFRCSRLLVKPQKVLYHSTAAVASGLRLGVLVPDQDQIAGAQERWRGAAQCVKAEAASPYGEPGAVQEAASRLKAWGADIVVMDCIGYTLAMKESVKGVTGKPVILARSILARVLAELL
ncbi:MAG: AroM family protein [Bacillota bacterium]